MSTKKTPKTPQPVVNCPDCETKVKLKSDLNTDWYGNLKYYKCSNCKQIFVSQNGGELELAALR